MPFENHKLIASPNGIYHAATVCCPDAAAVGNFGDMTGKSLVWTMVPNTWLNEIREDPDAPPDPGIVFPTQQATELYYDAYCIPFIRMSPRSQRFPPPKTGEPHYSVERIAKGDFTDELTAWGLAAKAFDRPLLVEFGAEMNGYWQPWNATYNGADALTKETLPDGSPRYLGQKHYRNASIYIIELFRSLEVENVTWVFHVNADNNPNDNWNRMAGYYPGDEYIDWIGVSCYAAYEFGPLTPLKEILDPVIDEIRTFSPGVVAGTKPIAITELGAIDYPCGSKPRWIRESYRLLARGKGVHGFYRDQIKAVSWWDETWWEGETDNALGFLQNNSVASSPASVSAYREALSRAQFLGRP